MTKIKLIGDSHENKKSLKPLEFVYFLNRNNVLSKSFYSSPAHFIEIEVKKIKRHNGEFDCVCFCKTKSGDEHTYFGKFNDGIINYKIIK